MHAMPSFADNVRIRASEETERLQLAGREGTVFGFTTPSVTGVEVIGSTADDFALHVHFNDLNEGYWFAESLEWVRLPNGDWEERPKKPRGQ